MTRRLRAPQHATRRPVLDPWVPGVLLGLALACVALALANVGGGG